jgi:hypothetical protein
LEEESEPTLKNFLYLIQGPSELPSHLESILKTNYSEVVMLSFKEQTSKTTLFFPNSTWTQGRNMLFHYAKRLEQRTNCLFKYWIFLDEDVRLDAVQLRRFEQFLLDYEPAVGVPKIPWNPRISSPSTGIAGDWKVLPVYHFDGIFNAFHREAVEWLLPYNASFDDSSWWTSQLILIHKAGMWYQSHILEFTDLVASNPFSRKYPRSKTNWKEIQDDFGNALPSKMKACFFDKGQLGFNVTTKSLLWGTVRRKDAPYNYPPSFQKLQMYHPHYKFSLADCGLHT